MAQEMIKFISFEDFQKLYKSEKKKEVKLAMLLGFGSGLRISEIVGFKRRDGSNILALKAEQIDLKAHQIKILDAKGKKWRVTITPPLLTEEYLKLLPITIPRRTLQYHFNILTTKVLGRKLNFHTLRHGFGNYQANVLKLPLPIVQQMMGHSRLDTTGIYTKANPEYAISQAWKAMTGENR
jgi:integrase/recombinase XerD